METTVKTAPASPRSGERVLQALSTLAALLDRTINEVKTLDSEFEVRLHQEIQATVGRVRDEVTRDLTDRFQQEIQTMLEASRIEFETERERLTATMNEAVRTASHLKGQHQQINQDLNQATQAAVKLEAERSRLMAEMARIREDAKSEIERARAAAETAAVAAQQSSSRSRPREVEAEIARVEARIREISAVIEDPATELTLVIRKNVERSELDSYLKGIRLVLDSF
jgi:chromosome segregation ATPase